MNSKKGFLLFGGCCILVIGVTIAGIMIGESSFSQEREKPNIYGKDTNIDKDSLYLDYVIKTLVKAIKDEDGILDCKIDVEHLNGKIISANVNVVAENDEINISETNILNYISKTLEISTEDIILSFD